MHTSIDPLSERILDLFRQMNADSLDLHSLFEAGGNDTQTREQVVDNVERLSRLGYLESLGSDFYKLTDKGHAAAAKK